MATNLNKEKMIMFNTTQTIYSRPDGSFVITFADNPYHLSKDDPSMSQDLWDEVMEFIKENPDAVKPEPEPPSDVVQPELADVPPEQMVDTHSFVLGLMGVSDDE